MQLWRLWVLRGPNVWAACPVLEVGVDLREWVDVPRDRSEEVRERLRTWIPSLQGERDASDEFDPAQIFEQLLKKLQILAGNPVRFSASRSTDGPDRYRVAVEYHEEPVGRACVQTALAMCRAAWEGQPFPVADELARLRALADDQRLGPSTFAIVEAARARDIPVDHFNPEDGRYLMLGQGARQHRSLAAETDEISALSRSITTDKHLTKQLLREAGVPVPFGRPVVDENDAWEAACALGLPVVIKPQDRDMAVGVGLNLRTREQVVAAYRTAKSRSDYVLVERFAEGAEHRVLVVEDRVVAVALIEPPLVVGDGISTVAELVEAVNRDPRRGEAYPAPLRRIRLDAVALKMLAAAGYTVDSVPPAGQRVILRCQLPHLDHGGFLRDVTDVIHPETAACIVAAAQALRVRVAGVDVVARDISRPLEEQGGVIVEVNTGPGLGLHTAPYTEQPRPVGAAIVASMFPPGDNGRIPIVAVAGSRGRAAGRTLSTLLTDAGYRVGRTGYDGVFIAGRKINLRDASAHEKARALLRNNRIDIAILECEARDLLRDGFGCDRCDVVLVADPPEEIVDRLPKANGQDEEAPVEEAWIALLHGLASDGKVVLNADDPPDLDDVALPTDRVIWFARRGDNSRLIAHRADGGTAVYLGADCLVIAQGVEEQRMAFGGRPAQRDPREQLALLAALSGAMALNQCGDEEEPVSRVPISTPLELTLSAV
jgi:cyanophycin synthetase